MDDGNTYSNDSTLQETHGEGAAGVSGQGSYEHVHRGAAGEAWGRWPLPATFLTLDAAMEAAEGTLGARGRECAWMEVPRAELPAGYFRGWQMWLSGPHLLHSGQAVLLRDPAAFGADREPPPQGGPFSWYFRDGTVAPYWNRTSGTGYPTDLEAQDALVARLRVTRGSAMDHASWITIGASGLPPEASSGWRLYVNGIATGHAVMEVAGGDGR